MSESNTSPTNSSSIAIVLDTSFERNPTSSVCWYCKHYDKLEKCAAFPELIPTEIWNGNNPHTEPYPGDNGIQFEERDYGQPAN